MSTDPQTPVHLVKGGDDVLRGDVVSALVDRLVADDDRSMMVEEFAGNDYELGAVVAAAQTPPFLADRRVVVVRHLGRFARADDLVGLLAYLDDPMPTTRLVLVWERPVDPTARLGAVPAKLAKAVTAAGGEVHSADAPMGRAMAGWVAQQLSAAGISVDEPGQRTIVEVLGDDAGALIGVIERLVGTFGTGAVVSAADIEPYLGSAGGVPPWELTDALDRGDVPAALDRLHRMMDGGGRHPLAIMATLQTHYTRMLRLDGAEIRGEQQAAELLGLKGSTFPARKALAQGRRLRHNGVVRAIRLLAQADLALRGAMAWPEELAMEVLVARLAALSRSPPR